MLQRRPTPGRDARSRMPGPAPASTDHAMACATLDPTLSAIFGRAGIRVTIRGVRRYPRHGAPNRRALYSRPVRGGARAPTDPRYPRGPMTEILTESFCERCGTRYTFESARPRARLTGVKVLSRGLRNFVLSDDTSMDEAMAAARSEAEREATAQQLDAFHKTFNFCMTCRQYTCPNCWNEVEARCLSCAPMALVEPAVAVDELLSLGDATVFVEPAVNGLPEHVHEGSLAVAAEVVEREAVAEAVEAPVDEAAAGAPEAEVEAEAPVPLVADGEAEAERGRRGRGRRRGGTADRGRPVGQGEVADRRLPPTLPTGPEPGRRAGGLRTRTCRARRNSGGRRSGPRRAVRRRSRSRGQGRAPRRARTRAARRRDRRRRGRAADLADHRPGHDRRGGTASFPTWHRRAIADHGGPAAGRAAMAGATAVAELPAAVRRSPVPRSSGHAAGRHRRPLGRVQPGARDRATGPGTAGRERHPAVRQLRAVTLRHRPVLPALRYRPEPLTPPRRAARPPRVAARHP